MLNVVAIQGRFVSTPELRTTPAGTSVTSFTLACDTGYGEKKKTSFVDVVAWRSTSEFISKWFKKGDMVIVEGTIQTRNYTDKQGNKRKATEIVANNVSFCGGKEEKTEKSVDIDTSDFEEIQGDEELPFD